MADVVWSEDRVEAALKSLDAIANTLRRIATAIEGDPKNPVLPRLAKAIEDVASKKKEKQKDR